MTEEFSVPPPLHQSFFKKYSKQLFTFFIVILLISFAISKYFKVSSSKIFPYEHFSTVASPKQKLEQIITNNVIFNQINTMATPVYSVDEKHDRPIQSFLTIKSALNEMPQANIKRKTIISAKGKIAITPDSDSKEFELKTAILNLVNSDKQQALTDLIVNGSIGNVQFDDETQDALHISLTQTGSNDSFLKINLSDYMLIFINRIIHPDQPKGSQISVNTDDIWPFLGQYLHIPRSFEAIRFGEDLPDTDKLKLESIRKEVDVLFDQTLGKFSSYAEITESPSNTSGSSSIIVKAIIDSNKLIEVLVNYFKGIRIIDTKYKSDFEIMCQNGEKTKESIDDCLETLNTPPLTDDQIETGVASFISTLTFGPITTNIDSKDFSLLNFNTDITFTNSKFDSDSVWKFPIPLASFVIHFEIGEENIKDLKNIFKPINSINIASAGDNTKTFIDESFKEQSIQGEIYRENKNNLLNFAYVSNNSYCAGFLTKEYCIDAPEVWKQISSAQEKNNLLSLIKKSVDPNETENTTIMINQSANSLRPIECIYGEIKNKYGVFINYKDIVTQDGLTLRLSEPVDIPDLEYKYYSVCTVVNGKYFETTPYGNININPGPLNFDETVEMISPILNSLRWKNPITSSAIEVSIAPRPIVSYNFDKQPFKIKSGDTTFVYLYGATSPGTSGVCNTSNAYLKDQFQVDSNTIFVLPNGFGVCLSQKLCSVCNNGRLEEPSSNVATCKKQACNP